MSAIHDDIDTKTVVSFGLNHNDQADIDAQTVIGSKTEAGDDDPTV